MTIHASTPQRLCTICARGGSVGVPGKNTRLIGGVPLIAHSIRQARESGLFALIAVDSDSQEILDVAREFGADLTLVRPADMATSAAPKVPVIHRAASEVERLTGLRFDTFVDLDATSPLRLPDDIVQSVALLEDSGCENVITGAASHRSPYFNLVELDADGVAVLSKPSTIARRQDSPRCFDMNGSVYVWRREPFMTEPFLFGPSTRLFEMPRERSVDIDEPIDLRIVEMLLGDAG
ncbi:MAG: acylneuraminate cytidylyltransferase family protein [Acidimicrobiales bacterium]